MTQRLSAIWGQPIVIENKAGGATEIAAELVAKSAPDGYTLFATGMETFAINPFMVAKLSYDPRASSRRSAATAFEPVPGRAGGLAVQDVGGRDGPCQAKPGELNYATIGLGGSSHINMVLFESMTGLKLTPVHYRGGAPAPPTCWAGTCP